MGEEWERKGEKGQRGEWGERDVEKKLRDGKLMKEGLKIWWKVGERCVEDVWKMGEKWV